MNRLVKRGQPSIGGSDLFEGLRKKQQPDITEILFKDMKGALKDLIKRSKDTTKHFD